MMPVSAEAIEATMRQDNFYDALENSPAPESPVAQPVKERDLEEHIAKIVPCMHHIKVVRSTAVPLQPRYQSQKTPGMN
jgi:hypothetical protein